MPWTRPVSYTHLDVYKRQVYHLAGVIEINKGNEDMTWKVNVDGTKNVVEACKKCGVKRLVYACLLYTSRCV